MAFDGYLTLAGEEIINVARVRAYIANHLPMLNLTSNCCPCEALNEALGDAPYASPMQDEAPWFSPYNQATQEFYGLLPLSLEGFDDSSRQVPITETTGDGAVSARPRNASKDLRVTALMVASTTKGMDAGMSWLRDALAGSACVSGDCSGDDICFLSSCPEVCDWTGYDTVPLSLEYEFMSEAEREAAIAEWDIESGLVASVGGIGPIGLIAFDTTGSLPGYASTLVCGLIPGATYRVNARVASTGPIRLEIAGLADGADVNLIGYSGATSLTPEGPGTFEFVARDDTVRLRLVVTGAGTTALVTSLSMEMVTGKSIVAVSWPRYSNPDGTPWVQAWTPPATVTRVREVDRAAYTYGSTSGSPVLIAAHTAILQRTLRGLTPGQQYRLHLSAGPKNEVGPVMKAALSVDGAAWFDQSIAWEPFVVDFTPDTSEVTLRISNAVDVSVSTSVSWSQAVDYMRLEAVVPSGVTYPNPIDPVRRSYSSVVTTSGPIVTQTYPPRNAVLQKVEWTMNAGNPRITGTPVPVAQVLSPSVQVVPEIVCVNGAAVRHNLFTNPSVETTLTGYSLGGTTTNLTLARVADPANSVPPGTFVGRILAGAFPALSPYLNVALPTLSAGVTYTASIYLMASDVRWLALSITDSSNNAQYAKPSFRVDSAGMRRASITFVASAATTQFHVRVFGGALNDSTTWTSGDYVLFDAAQLEVGGVATMYFDGDSVDGEWDGVANESASTWTRHSVSAIIDPDCPPPQAPPRPPVFIDPCISNPALWLRYTMDVPAQAVGSALTTLPVLTLTTSEDAARGVRVRLVANPRSEDPSTLDPCGQCGEFLLSYMPPYAALTVDASTRQVTIVANGDSQSAMTLLYGSNGGPMTWPELTCGIPYALLIDLDASEPALVSVDLSVVPSF